MNFIAKQLTRDHKSKRAKSSIGKGYRNGFTGQNILRRKNCVKRWKTKKY